jgi:hypothetical protein
LIDPWADYYVVALYLISLGVALEGTEESRALERLLFDLAGIKGSNYRRIMAVWQELPNQLRRRTLDGLHRGLQDDVNGLRQAAAVLPHTKADPQDAWSILELLLDEPDRGCQKTIYEESPWDYLFLHLDEIPSSLSAKLDAWAEEDPAFFVYTMDEGLVKNWERLPLLWRNGLFHPDCYSRHEVWDRLVRTIAQHWGKAPQSVREWFDFLARSETPTIRALVGSQALFYAERHPDLERYAFSASRDPEPLVRLETFRWGRGDESHHHVAELLLEGASPGFAAEIMLDLLEEEIREEIAPWEKDVLIRCERLGGDAVRAAITSAILAGKARPVGLGYKLADSPFEEPEIVRAAWFWHHLDSHRSRPPLTDDDLRNLLLSLKDVRIRAWCLALASHHATELPEGFGQLLSELGASSRRDADAIRMGAKRRRDKRPLYFHIGRLVS